MKGITIMKIIKRIAAVTVSAAIAVLPLAVTVSAANEYSKARDGVVLVTSSAGAGSGFAIGIPGEAVEYIVTNYHVLEDEHTGAVDTHPTVWYNRATGNGDSPQVVALDQRNDLAVLKLSEPTTIRTALTICRTENLNTDDEVYAYGFPDYGSAGKDYETSSQKDIVGSDGIVQNKTTIESRDGTPPDISVIMTSCLISHGNSGGPLVNEQGQVVGVVSLGIGGDDLFDSGYAITSDALINLLNANGISFTLSTDAIAAGEADATEGEAATATEVAEESNGVTIVFIIIGAVMIVGIIAVIVIFMRKKNNGTTKGVANGGGQFVAASSQQAVIICTKGLLAGRSYNLGGSAVIGRNTQRCSICYPIDAQGISGVHCEIRQTANGYEIIDRGSSYGTFLGSGQKLVPDVPAFLPNGTYFYLGSPEQLFQIKY